MQAMLDELRQNPPKKIGNYDVLAVRDYLKDEITDTKTGKVTTTGLPKSNVLYYDLNDDAWCCARPSGTEPKVKFYIGVKGTSFEDANSKMENLKKSLMEIVNK